MTTAVRATVDRLRKIRNAALAGEEGPEQ